MYCIQTLQPSQRITTATKVRLNHTEYLIIARHDHVSICNLDLLEIYKIHTYAPVEQIVPLSNSFLCFTSNLSLKITLNKKFVYEKQNLFFVNLIKKITGFSKSLSTKNYFVLKSYENSLVIGYKNEDDYVLDQSVCDFTFLEAIDFTGDKNKLFVMYKGLERTKKSVSEQENVTYQNIKENRKSNFGCVYETYKANGTFKNNTFIVIYRYSNKKLTATETVQVHNIYKMMYHKNELLLLSKDYMYKLEDNRNNTEKKRKASQECETKKIKNETENNEVQNLDTKKVKDICIMNTNNTKNTKRTTKIVQVTNVPNKCVIDCSKLAGDIFLLCSNRELLCFCDGKFVSYGFLDFYIDKIIFMYDKTFFGASYNDNSIVFELNNIKNKQLYNKDDNTKEYDYEISVKKKQLYNKDNNIEEYDNEKSMKNKQIHKKDNNTEESNNEKSIRNKQIHKKEMLVEESYHNYLDGNTNDSKYSNKNLTHEFKNKYISTIKTLVNLPVQQKIEIQNNSLITKTGYYKNILCTQKRCIKLRNKKQKNTNVVSFKHKITNLFVFQNSLFVSFLNSFAVYDYKKMKIVRVYKNGIQNFYVSKNNNEQHNSTSISHGINSNIKNFELKNSQAYGNNGINNGIISKQDASICETNQQISKLNKKYKQFVQSSEDMLTANVQNNNKSDKKRNIHYKYDDYDNTTNHCKKHKIDDNTLSNYMDSNSELQNTQSKQCEDIINKNKNDDKLQNIQSKQYKDIIKKNKVCHDDKLQNKQSKQCNDINNLPSSNDTKTFYSLSLHSDKKESSKQENFFILNTQNEMITKNDIFSTDYVIILSSYYNNHKLIYGRRNSNKILLLCDEETIKKESVVQYNVSTILLSQHVYVSTYNDQFFIFDYDFRILQTIKIETFYFGFLLHTKNIKDNCYTSLTINNKESTCDKEEIKNTRKNVIDCMFATKNGDVYCFDGTFTKIVSLSAIIYKITQIKNGFFVKSENNYILKIKKKQTGKIKYRMYNLENNDIECLIDDDKQMFYSIKNKVYLTKNSLKPKIHKKIEEYENEISEIIQIKNTNKRIIIFTKHGSKKIKTICVLYNKNKKLCEIVFDGIYKISKLSNNEYNENIRNIEYNDNTCNENMFENTYTTCNVSGTCDAKQRFYVCVNYLKPLHNKIYIVDIQNDEFNILCEIKNDCVLYSFDVFDNLILIGLDRKVLICTEVNNEINEIGVIRDILLPRNILVGCLYGNNYYIIVNGAFVTTIYHLTTTNVLKEMYTMKTNYQNCIKADENTILLYEKNNVCFFSLQDCKIIKKLRLTENIVDAKCGRLEFDNYKLKRCNNTTNDIKCACHSCKYIDNTNGICDESMYNGKCTECCKVIQSLHTHNVPNVIYLLTAFGSIQKIYNANQILSDSETDLLKTLQNEITKNDNFMYDFTKNTDILYLDILKTIKSFDNEKK